jgi:branched-chain amino acid transport system ATP-binding protein
MTALTVSDLSRSFGGVQALTGVSFTVEPGERRLFIGPNGAGKTTLFNTISGTFFASTGSIVLFDRDITQLASYERARLGLARTFQITNLFLGLTVFDNVLLAMQAAEDVGFALGRPMTAYRHLYDKVGHLLDEWGLAGVRRQIVRHLSYGEQRQVDLILALAGSPRVLLLDEPTAGLSAAESVRVVAMVRSLPREITILMIEHDMDVALDLADRITVLHMGEVIAEGDRETIRAHPQVNEIYLGTE